MLVDDHEVVRGGIRARRPQTRVLMLTSFADDEALLASIVAGAAGYVLKHIGGGDLVRAIHTVGRGESLLDPEELALAEKTVKNYVSSALTKLEVARRAEAAAYLARHGGPPRA
ncbi:MAG TPA: LuxR C-terminal-related transcriptional regulator [Actinomycetota bacterium]|jgi:two-component system, NarL family, response regulator DevR